MPLTEEARLKNNARSKAWAAANKERMKFLYARWAKNNPDKVREKCKRYRELYPERHKQYRQDWQEQNHEKYLFYKRQYGHRKRAQRVKEITHEDWHYVLEICDNRCLCCTKDLVFLTMDHVIPLVKGGDHDLLNIQPLCFSCNSMKHTTAIDYRTREMIERIVERYGN